MGRSGQIFEDYTRVQAAIAQRDVGQAVVAVRGREARQVAVAAGTCSQAGWPDGFDAMLDLFIGNAGNDDERGALLLDEVAGNGFVHGCRRLLAILPAWLRPPERTGAITAAIVGDAWECLDVLLDGEGHTASDFEHAFRCARRNRSRACLSVAAGRVSEGFARAAFDEMAEAGAWAEADAVACGISASARRDAVAEHGRRLPMARMLAWQESLCEGGRGGGRRRA